MSINQVIDALKTDIDAAIEAAQPGLLNGSYGYETMPDRLQRSYAIFWERGAPYGSELTQGGRNQSFAIIPAAKFENTPASQEAADRDLNDMTDAIMDYLAVSINKPYWTKITFPQEAARGFHPDLKQVFWRVIRIRVNLR